MTFRPLLVLLACSLLLLGLAACGGERPAAAPNAPGDDRHPVLGVLDEVVLDRATGRAPTPGSRVDRVLASAREGSLVEGAAPIAFDLPFDGTVFPPGFVPPTFLWHDESAADTWWIEIRTAPSEAPVEVLVPGRPPPRGTIDERAVGPTNELPRPTPRQAALRSWTPSEALWRSLQTRTTGREATLVLRGFRGDAPGRWLGEGQVRFRTSPDEVGAPIFYRDVPLLPSVGEKGKIQPLGPAAIPLIAWRLKDVTRPDNRLVLTDMPTCANCHSFSQDGSTFGMDVDGPDGDKGTYAIAPLRASMSLDYDDLITWNSFEDKPEGHNTIGFLSRVSPDGRYVVTTVNEELYVANFTDYRVLQVFFPTRGILAYYDRQTKTMHALPGADDPDYVHCGPTWSPDGTTIVFSRAPARDAYVPGVPRATHPNDPNEPQVRYDLVRIPFDGGRGGVAEPVVGASQNGMSNTFPKISPDGKWIVWTRCRNGQLLRPDSRLWIVPFEGGEARELACNLPFMNSWHSFSPSGRWLVWTSKSFTPYTQMFLTHLDEEGNASPAVLIPDATAANRAVNLPEFLNAPYDALKSIDVPAVKHRRHYLVGTRMLERGDLEGALGELARAVEIEPDFARAHVNLGFTLLRLGRAEEATRHFEHAVTVSPWDAFAQTNYAAAMLEAGNVGAALEHARRALEQGGEYPSANNTYGLALVRDGRAAEGVPYFERALEYQPGFWQARRNLAFALKELGRLDEAAQAFEAVLELRPNDEAVKKALSEVRAP